MINTFHSSYNPPPVPPRAGYSKPLPAGNTPLVKFLSVMILLLMILTFGGFLYLFQKLNVELQGTYYKDMATLERLKECVDDNSGKECLSMMKQYEAVMEKLSQTSGKPSKQTGGSSFNRPAAHMIFQNEHKRNYMIEVLKSNNLLWDPEHSLLQDVELNSRNDMLKINTTGIYFIYSQVTFSKRTKTTLKQTVNSTGPMPEDKKELLRSYCSLHETETDVCTTFTAGVFNLRKGQQIYVTVTNTTLVNKAACNFGLFKLW